MAHDTTSFAKNVRLTLIGCGKMGLAMLEGWLGIARITQFDVIDPVPSAELLKLVENNQSITLYKSIESYYGRQEDRAPSSHNKEYLSICVLAVKPQMMQDVLQSFILGGQQNNIGCDFDAVMSIAAGVSLSFFEIYFPSDVALIRVMPNTSAAIGKGVSVYCTQSNCAAHIVELTQELLNPLGKVYRISEEQDMHAVTAISGSGPAYIFALTEALGKAALSLGLSEDIAADLARYTVIGAASLMDAQSEYSAADLRKAVTSPGGTTQAALEILQGASQKNETLDTLMAKATQKAKDRSIELASYDNVS